MRAQRLLEGSDVGKILPLANPDVHQQLRIERGPLRQLGQGFPGTADQGHQLQRGDEPVSRGIVVEEDDMSRLLSAKVVVLG